MPIILRTSIKLGAVFITVLSVAMMLAFPQASLQAALTGVGIWWEVLFPALFPFFIIAELLLSFGLVHFFGTLLDPLMRPLFRVPGIGGFVMAMGFASGYPIGAKLTSQLWDEQLVNRVESERLVAFTSTADPIFLIGAVAVGFFHDAKVAVILGIAHYSASVLIGLLMRFHAGSSPMTPPSSIQKGSILLNALRNMHNARLAETRPFGIVMRDAAITALRLVFVIGGLVVFFSVTIELLTRAEVLSSISNAIAATLSVLGIPGDLSDAFINGLFEVTLGAKSAGAADGAGLLYQAAAAAFILSWAGLSVHAQIVSLMSHTGMRYMPFLIARFLHGLMAMWIVLLLWPLLQTDIGSNASVTGLLPASKTLLNEPFTAHWIQLPIMFGCICLAILCLCSIALYWSKQLYSRWRERH